MSRPVVVLILTMVSCSVAACVHLLMSASLFLWHAVHDGYLGNASPWRLQVYVCLQQWCQQHWPKASVRERICPRHESRTDSDVRLGRFQHKGIAALMPKPTCRVWSGISLPNSFLLTGSSTPVPSGNGGEDNCISASATAHLESSPQSNWWYATTLQCKVW
jgi:hypothetical protein